MKILNKALELTNYAYEGTKNQLGNLGGRTVSVFRRTADFFKAHPNVKLATHFAVFCLAMSKLIPIIEKSSLMNSLSQKLEGTRFKNFVKAYQPEARMTAMMVGAAGLTALLELAKLLATKV